MFFPVAFSLGICYNKLILYPLRVNGKERLCVFWALIREWPPWASASSIPRMVQYGAITTPAGMPLAARLVQIGDDLEQLIRQFQPDEMSIEELFFSKNITTGIAVAHGRGVLLYTAEKLHLPVYEYTPMQIKQAVVGYGLAEKRQVMDMTRRLLKLKAVPRPDDAADALAIAICHARSATSLLRRKDPDVKETV